ncbi:MAG: LysM peptidoglycan-binding domain-containing protein [Thermoflexales bacterium]|nr:LysM peptidoglycan-binding domain-containing protein [Thermoflexales bacterium]
MDWLKRRITIAINGTYCLSIPIVAIIAAILAMCVVCCCCLALLAGAAFITRSIEPTPLPTHHPSVTPPAVSMLETPAVSGTVSSTVPFPTMTITSSLVPPTATSTGTPAPPPPSRTPSPTPVVLVAGQCPPVYAVQAGDTVLGIATKCGLTVDDIVRANNLANSSSLTIGQQLVLPAGGQVVTTPQPVHTPAATPLPPAPSPTGTPIVGRTPTSSPTPTRTTTPGEEETPTHTATPGTTGTPTSTTTPGEGETPTSTTTPGGDETPSSTTTPGGDEMPTSTTTPGGDETPTSTTTPGGDETPSSTATTTHTPTPSPTSSGQASNCEVTDAWVHSADLTPTQNQVVRVFAEFMCNGSPVSGAQMKSRWNFDSGVQECTGTTDADGIATCELNIGAVTSGHRVQIDISVTWEGNEYIYQGDSIGFTPQ